MIKALQWSKEDGEGRVVLEAKKALIPLYQRFFDAHKDEMERKPIVLELGYGRIKNEEDYLSDEDSGLNKTKIKFLTDRAKAKGRNFIALTGAITPWELSNYENSFTNEYSELAAKYSIHPLWTVLRGTMEIVNYWNRELQLPKLTIGHSISGCAVDDRNAKLPNTQQVLKCILEKVQTILNGTSKNGEQHKNTVAVICTDRVECTELQRILKDNNISVRSVDENDNPNASVVVDWHNNVLSYEWQTVLVVSLYYPTEFNPRFLPLAASRTICRLIIIGRDAMTAVNGVTEKYPNTDLSSIPYSNFEKSVMKLSQEVGETDHFAIEVNRWYSALHLNYLPSEVRAMDEKLSQCKDLTDYLSLMANDKVHLMAFCRCSWYVEPTLKKCKQLERKVYFHPPRMSEFFKELLPIELQCAFDGFIPIYCAAVTALSIDELENGNVQYSDKVKQLSNQLNECDAWRKCTRICVDDVLISSLTCAIVPHSQSSISEADNLRVRKLIN